MRHSAREAKVTEHDARVCADQHILGLHVTVNYPVRVQVVQSSHELHCDGLDGAFRQCTIILKYLEELALPHEAHQLKM